ncbi:uncharacterized protein ACNLHF_002004 [Anomaloglossus baeobatrachus]
MESLRSVIASMSQGDFLASIDIKDAYLHVPIAPEHQRFLRFVIEDEHFQFVVVLRPIQEFLPKVVSSFHLNQDISLPSFCPHPVHRCFW